MGVDVIDGSYAVRACAAGAALLLRDCDRGQDARRSCSAHDNCSAASSATPAKPSLAPESTNSPWTASTYYGAAAAAAASAPSGSHEELKELANGEVKMVDQAFYVSEPQPQPIDVASRPTQTLRNDSKGSDRGRAAQARPHHQANAAASGKEPRKAAEEDVHVALRQAAAAVSNWDADDTAISLWSERFRWDAGPLCKGCSCYACQRHTRAYIHHLLHVHEMLAQVTIFCVCACSSQTALLADGNDFASRVTLDGAFGVPNVLADAWMKVQYKYSECSHFLETLLNGGFAGSAGDAQHTQLPRLLQGCTPCPQRGELPAVQRGILAASRSPACYPSSLKEQPYIQVHWVYMSHGISASEVDLLGDGCSQISYLGTIVLFNRVEMQSPHYISRNIQALPRNS